jgi:oxygen-independent coproporphyrinogen-3 oxidase
MTQVVPCKSSSDHALAEKYACAGPRYTSYPTALQFSDDFAVQDFLEGIRNGQAATNIPLSLYVHVPFCHDICYYCACNKIVTRDESASRRYLNFLSREISMQGQLHGDKRPVTQMHWGGGTPTYLDDAELTELMHELATHFQLLDSGYREYSIEIDPRTVATGRIALLKGLGFNRISLGIQDFDPLVQKSINRIQPLASVRKLVSDIRHHDFRSLSFDLIYGLPYQDQFTMETTLQRVIDLKPDRIACYNYAHLPDRFPSQRAIDRLSLPSPQEKLALQELISNTLQAAGYVHIGMDHYVHPDDDLAIAQNEGRLQRNFQGYSVNMAADLLGIGVSAISQIGDSFVQNERNIDNYYTRLSKSQLPINRGCEMNDEDKLRRHVIMELICNLQLDIRDTERRFNIEFNHHFAAELARLNGMQADGLLQAGNGNLQITERGRPFLRNICMIFDQYLVETPDKGHSPRYSATL